MAEQTYSDDSSYDEEMSLPDPYSNMSPIGIPGPVTPPTWIPSQPKPKASLLDRGAAAFNDVWQSAKDGSLPEKYIVNPIKDFYTDPGFSGIRRAEDLSEDQRTRQEQVEIDKKNNVDLLKPVIPGPSANSPPGSGSGSGSGSGMGSGSGSGSGSGIPSRNEAPENMPLKEDNILDYRPEKPVKGLRPFDIRKLDLFKLANFSADIGYTLNFNMVLLRAAMARREAGLILIGPKGKRVAYGERWYSTNDSSATGLLQYLGIWAMAAVLEKAPKAYRDLLLPEYVDEYNAEKEAWSTNQRILKEYQLMKPAWFDARTEVDPNNPAQRRWKKEHNPYPFLPMQVRDGSTFTNIHYLDSRFAVDEMAFLDTFGNMVEEQLKCVVDNLVIYGAGEQKASLVPELVASGNPDNGTYRVKGRIDGVFPYWAMYIAHFAGTSAAPKWIRADNILLASNSRDKYQWTSPALGVGPNDNPLSKKDDTLDLYYQNDAAFAIKNPFAMMPDEKNKVPGTNSFIKSYTMKEFGQGLHRAHQGYTKGYILTSLPSSDLCFYGNTWDKVIGGMQKDMHDYYVKAYNKYVLPNIQGIADKYKLKAYRPSPEKQQVLLFADFSDRINEYYRKRDDFFLAFTGLGPEAKGLSVLEILDRDLQSNLPTQGAYREQMSQDMMPDMFEHFLNFYSIYAANKGYGLYSEGEPIIPQLNISPTVTAIALTREEKYQELEADLRKDHWIINPNVSLTKDTATTPAGAPANPTATPTAKAGSAPAEFPARGGSGEQ